MSVVTDGGKRGIETNLYSASIMTFTPLSCARVQILTKSAWSSRRDSMSWGVSVSVQSPSSAPFGRELKESTSRSAGWGHPGNAIREGGGFRVGRVEMM